MIWLNIFRTLDYVYNELPKIPDNIPVLVLGNHCDMNHHRSVNGDEIIYYLRTLERFIIMINIIFVIKICIIIILLF